MMAKQVKTTSKTAIKAASKAVKKPEKAPAKKIEKNEAAKKHEQIKIKLVSAEELAKFVGVTVRRIQQLTKEGVIEKKPGSDKYDFVRTIHSLLQYYRVKSDSRRSSDSEEMANEKLKQISVKRRLEELKLAQLEGELHKAEDIEKVVGLALTRLRINLLAIAMGVAPNNPEIAEKITERICRAMEEVAAIDIDKLLADENAVEREE